MLKIIILLITSYLIGSIPVAYIYCKLKGVDIRKKGSGNVGATNAGRIFGKQAFFLVFFLDALKGFVPVNFLVPLFINTQTVNLELIQVLTLFAVIGGHIWTIFLKFKGGKGVATSMGGLIAIMPQACILSVILFATILAIKRIVSISSIVAALFLPVFCLFTTNSYILFAFSTFLAIIIVFTHRTNIIRLLKGTETKLTRKEKG